MICLASVVLLHSCVFSEIKGIFEKTNQITSVLQNNCDCESVGLSKYSIENTITTATYRLVGCKYNDIEEEALRVKEILSDSIPDFCEIDHFNLVFISDGWQKVMSFSTCQEEQGLSGKIPMN